MAKRRKRKEGERMYMVKERVIAVLTFGGLLITLGAVGGAEAGTMSLACSIVVSAFGLALAGLGAYLGENQKKKGGR